MARRSSRRSLASASRDSSKRPASPEEATRPKRTKVPTKSKYFEHASEEADSSALSSDGSEGSAFAEENEPTPSPSEAEDSSEGYASGEELKPAPRKRGRPAKKQDAASTSSGAKDGDLLKPDAKTGLRPGTQLIIKKPKAREAGTTPYTDGTIHPNTMLFLTDLRAHNERSWLKLHDPDYRASLNDFKSFVECLTQKVTEADDTIPELPVKDIVFKIYRDVRFSKDQTPYKTYLSAAWSRTGKKGPYAAYYVQIQPNGGNYIGGGLWMPEAQPLAALRHDIDQHPHRLKRVLTDARLRRAFFGGIGNDEKKAVRAFCEQNAENALKTKPKGYESDHKDIELLRLRNFTVGKKLPDSAVVGAMGLANIAELISCLVPFISHLNRVVMPDDPDGSSEDDGENEEEEHDVSGADDDEA